MYKSSQHRRWTWHHVALVFFATVSGARAQALPLPVQAALRQFIGGRNLSCQAEYTMEYRGLTTPITFKMTYWNSKTASRYDIDLANGSSFSRELANNLEPLKADKPVALSLNSSESYYTIWPDLKIYSEQFIFDDQRVFFQDKIRAVRSVISSEENMHGVSCIKYRIVFELEKTNKEAFAWVSKDSSALPVSVEMETEDFLGQEQKATVLFQNWKQEVDSDGKFTIPKDYKKVRDISEVMPKKINEPLITKGAVKVLPGISPQAKFFKSFLANPPDNSAEFIFIRVNTSDSKTNIYIAKQQSNAFFFREVNSMDEIDSTNQDPMKLIISRYNQNSWVLRNKMLFTSTDPLSKKRHAEKVDDISLWETSGQNILSEPLKMGILFANVKTFIWNGDNFIADDKDGGQLSGKLLLDDMGLPRRVIYVRELDKVAYQVDYKYSSSAESNAMPSEMTLTFANDGSYGNYVEAKPYKIYYITKYKTSELQLPEQEFSLEKYRNSIRPGGGIVYSNQIANVIVGGRIFPVSNPSIRNVRYGVFLCLFLTTIVFSTVLIRSYQKKQKTKNEKYN